MKKHAAAFIATSALALSATGAEPVKLALTLKANDEEGIIRPLHAFCAPAPQGHTRDGGNVSPEIGWNAGPAGTKSYVVLMQDPDVPTQFDDANKEGKTIPEAMPRRTFTHWVLVDIAANITRLPEGADSDKVEKAGKSAQATKYGIRGINDYGATHFGYDGPCPPWNDERWHHYNFAVYALDVSSLKLKGAFTADDALKAMKGHVLAMGSASGKYSQNPALVKHGK